MIVNNNDNDKFNKLGTGNPRESPPERKQEKDRGTKDRDVLHGPSRKQKEKGRETSR